MISDLWQDVRYGLRGMRRDALLSIVVVATLSLGIGVSTGVFTYYNSELLRARVDKDFDSFVRVYSSYTTDPARPGRPGPTTLADFLAFRDQAKSLANLAAYEQVDVPLGEDDPVDVRTLMVTSNFFSLYGLDRPLMGRLLLPEDCSAASPVAVLSERLWRNQYAADPGIVGKVVHFNGQPVTVVGVTPMFAGMVNNTRAWLPYTLGSYLQLGDSRFRSNEAAWLIVEGRLNPGFTRRDVAEELKLIASQQDRLHPERQSVLTVTNGSAIEEPGNGGTITWAMSLIVGALVFFVLIVCVNVTTLLLSRAAGRRHEIAVRLAVGAGRLRLIRMLLVGTALHAVLAGVVGLVIAYYLPALLRYWLVASRGDLAETWSVAPDWRAFVFLTMVTVAAGMVAGLTPAIQSLKVNLSDTLKGRNAGAGGGKSRLQRVLIGAQVAFSFVLLWWIAISAGAYRKTMTSDPGYEARHVMLTQVWTRTRATETHSWNAFHRTFTDRVRALPGVESVAYASLDPFNNRRTLSVEARGRGNGMVALNVVSPNYFDSVGIPIVAGRGLREDDPVCASSGCVAVVSQALARKFWPNENPLGQTLGTPRGSTLEIVGVARDVSTERLGGPDEPMIYLPWDPDAAAYNAYVRFSGDGAALAPAMTRILRDAAPDLSGQVQTIQSLVDWHIVDLGRTTVAIVFLGVMAIFLAALGIYGVVSSAVARRTRELGIRIALGAASKDIYSTVIGRHTRPIVVGLAVGLSVTLAAISAAAQVLRAQPFSLGVQDPMTYAVAAISLAVIALGAMLVPARRATRVDPIEVLRCE